MNIIRSKKFHLILLVILFIISFFFSPYFPDTVPIHWNFQGTIDRYGSKYELLFLMPLIASMIYFFSFIVEGAIQPMEEKALNILSFFRIYIILLLGGMNLYFIINTLINLKG